MTRFGKIISCVGCLAVIGFFPGCAPVRQQRYSSFLPPQARSSPVLLTATPPELPPGTGLDPDSVRNASANQSGPRQGRIDALLREADWHFQLGRKQYQDGDMAGARREFDRAIDILLTAPDTPGAPDRALQGPIERKLDELVDAVYKLDLTGLGAGDTARPAFDRAAFDDIPQMTFPVDPRLKNKVLDEVRATASQLPLQATDAVLSYINYFSSERGRKALLFGLRRAGRYKSLIHRILDEEGVPQELIYVAQAESAFLPRALSRKQAAGMWQFVSARGRQYGLTQTPLVDERLDFEKATRAAARHLRDLYQRYGDWYLALGAYNAGPGVIDKAVERTGYADFWEFRRRSVLPRETANYVPIILAMTIMVKNAREYDLENIVGVDEPISYDTFELDAPTSLALIADLAECPLPVVRELNPALLRDIAPPGTVRIPKGSGTQLAVLSSIPQERRLAWRVHRVSEGDSLASIARRYGVNESALSTINNHAFTGELRHGELLIVPAAQVKSATSKRASRLGSAKHRVAANQSGSKSTHTAKTSSSKARGTRVATSHRSSGTHAKASRGTSGKVAVAGTVKRGTKSARR